MCDRMNEGVRSVDPHALDSMTLTIISYHSCLYLGRAKESFIQVFEWKQETLLHSAKFLIMIACKC